MFSSIWVIVVERRDSVVVWDFWNFERDRPPKRRHNAIMSPRIPYFTGFPRFASFVFIDVFGCFFVAVFGFSFVSFFRIGIAIVLMIVRIVRLIVVFGPLVPGAKSFLVRGVMYFLVRDVTSRVCSFSREAVVFCV